MTDEQHKELRQLLDELKAAINCRNQRIILATRRALIKLLEIYLEET